MAQKVILDNKSLDKIDIGDGIAYYGDTALLGNIRQLFEDKNKTKLLNPKTIANAVTIRDTNLENILPFNFGIDSKGNYGYYKNNKFYLFNMPQTTLDTTGYIVSSFDLGTLNINNSNNIILENILPSAIIECAYSGSMKTCILPPGQYKLEVWGAQGGGVNGSKGGYSCGTLVLNDFTKVFLYAGGKGNYNHSTTGVVEGGFNGGGSLCYNYNSADSANSGGGGSDIRLGYDSLYARVIVAGGGTGANWNDAEVNGYGGGITGGTQDPNAPGGGQTAPTSGNIKGTFGGGMYLANDTYAPGGGWYGGSAVGSLISYTYPTTLVYGSGDAHGGGGSGYVYTASTAVNYPQGCLLNSSYYLTDAKTIAGNTSIIEPDGKTGTGHSGNGHVRITKIL